MNYRYYIIRLKTKISDSIPSPTYLGPQKGQSVYSVGEARCYRTYKGANKAAESLGSVPYWSPEVLGRVTHQSEFGGHTWFTVETLTMNRTTR